MSRKLDAEIPGSAARTPASESLWRFLAALGVIAFVLHLGWEYAQCRPFFNHGKLPATATAMLVATLGDLVLTGIAYTGVAATTRNWAWPVQAWTPLAWASLIGIALGLSIAIELHALAMGRWSYTELAPRLPMTPVSLVPVLQLVILLPLSFALAREAARATL